MDQEQHTTEQSTETTTSTMPTSTQAEPAKSIDGVSEYKLFAIIGYILPFLFFIPMLNESSKNNVYVRTHADQQLTLLVLLLGWTVVSQFLYMTMYTMMNSLGFVFNIAMFVFMVIGIINAVKGEAKKLPGIGQISLIGTLFK